MLLTKETEVKPNGKSVKYYRDKGYDAKRGVPLTVKVDDLSPCSSALVDVSCDYCGKTNKDVKYIRYYNQMHAEIHKYCCKDCTHLKHEEAMVKKYGHKAPFQIPQFKKKIQETNLERYGSVSPSGSAAVREKQKKTLMENYGVDTPMRSEEIKNKMKETNIKKYGVECVLENEEIRDKAKQTIINKYGVENVLFNDEIRAKRDATLIEKFGTLYPLQNEECYEKMKQTNMEKYGVEHVSQTDEVKQKVVQTSLEKYGVPNPLMSKEVQEKVKATNLEKYGVESILVLPEFHEHSRNVDIERYGVYHHLQNPEILAKQKETFHKNGTCPTSIQQIYLYNLYGGDMNYPVKHYNVDIYLPDDNLAIEYDGGGHDLNIKLGSLTPDEFNRKEIIRSSVIKHEGYKQMHIISSKDLIPFDTTLLQMLEHTRQYFNERPNHSWIEFNIDTSTVRNAEHKDGVFFDFGELRKIHQLDISDDDAAA